MSLKWLVTPVWTHLSFWEYWATKTCSCSLLPHPCCCRCASCGRRRTYVLHWISRTAWRRSLAGPELHLHTKGSRSASTLACQLSLLAWLTCGINEALARVLLQRWQLFLYFVDVFGVDEVKQALPSQLQLWVQMTQMYIDLFPFLQFKLHCLHHITKLALSLHRKQPSQMCLLCSSFASCLG